MGVRKVVDDVNTALLQDGCTVALSAAMPGLVGATFRTGGLLAAFRSDITHQEEGVPTETHGVGMVKIKLFNLLSLGRFSDMGYLQFACVARPVN